MIGGYNMAKMTEKEMYVLKRIPKKYRKHIVKLTITRSGDYNSRGRELNNYTITYDNGDWHRFQNQNYMLWCLREYDEDGYYVSP